MGLKALKSDKLFVKLKLAFPEQNKQAPFQCHQGKSLHVPEQNSLNNPNYSTHLMAFPEINAVIAFPCN